MRLCVQHAPVFAGRWQGRLEGLSVKALQGGMPVPVSGAESVESLDVVWLDELKSFGMQTLEFVTNSDIPETLEAMTCRLAHLTAALCASCSGITRHCLSRHPVLIRSLFDLSLLATRGSVREVAAAWLSFLSLWQREIAKTFDSALPEVTEGERSSWHLVDDAQIFLSVCISPNLLDAGIGGGDSLSAVTARILSHTFCREAALQIDHRFFKENHLAKKQREAARIAVQRPAGKNPRPGLRVCINN